MNYDEILDNIGYEEKYENPGAMITWMVTHKFLAFYLLGVLIVLVFVIIESYKDYKEMKRERGNIEISMKDLLIMILFTVLSYISIAIFIAMILDDKKKERHLKRKERNNRL